jgi:hypothetical protein
MRPDILLAAGILSFLVLAFGPVWITPWLLMAWGCGVRGGAVRRFQPMQLL